MFRLTVFLFALFISARAMAEDVPQSSLFFTGEESQKIETLAAKVKPENAEISGLHLGAVMYYGPGDWALWLQGERWTPETDRPDLHIVSVNEGEVQLSWVSSPGALPREVTLKPYQTYQPTTGKVIEGFR